MISLKELVLLLPSLAGMNARRLSHLSIWLKKIAYELGVTVEYLIGGTDKLVLDKKLLKSMEEIEALPTEDKERVYYFIDMAITYNKTKKAFS